MSKQKPIPFAVLKVMSQTHHGPGTPLTGKESRENVAAAKALLDELAPGLPTHGFSDEDYGWLVLLAPEQVEDLKSKYPEHEEIGDSIYLSDEAAICLSPRQEHLNDMRQAPVDRDKLFEDWFDNYGGN